MRSSTTRYTTSTPRVSTSRSGATVTTRYRSDGSSSSASSSAYSGRVLSSPYRISGSASRSSTTSSSVTRGSVSRSGVTRGSVTRSSATRSSVGGGSVTRSGGSNRLSTRYSPTRYTTSSDRRWNLRSSSTNAGRLSRSSGTPTNATAGTGRGSRIGGTTTAARLGAERAGATRQTGPRLAGRYDGSTPSRGRETAGDATRLRSAERRVGGLGSRLSDGRVGSPQYGERRAGGAGIGYGNQRYSGWGYQQNAWCAPGWGYGGGWGYGSGWCNDWGYGWGYGSSWCNGWGYSWCRPWYGSWCRPYYDYCGWWPRRCYLPGRWWGSWYCDSWMWNNLLWAFWPSSYSDVAIAADVAAAPLEEVVESDEERAAAELALGDYYFREGRYDDAAQAYLRAIELVPEDGSVRFVMADALFALGTYHYAAYMISKGLELDPLLAGTKIDKREYYGDPTEFGRHMEALDRYLIEKPYDAAAYLVKAYNLKFSDQGHEAVKALERCLHIEPGNRAARTLLDGFIEIGSPEIK